MKSSDEAAAVSAPELRRLKISLGGAVQGVGFRPFVFRLAQELGLAGWVGNSAQGVSVEAEGSRELLERFRLRLEGEKPPRSFIQSLESTWLDPVNYVDFQIRASTGGQRSALVLPDIATCPECRGEILDPGNRRYRYPFTNCTHCGPRYSIIEGLPYDRARTTMKDFAMCAQCAAEYENPADRRFHAQPNACPRCGPHLELWDRGGKILAAHHAALLAAATALRQGAVVALKGLGGFQLLVDARQEEAVRRLRQRKHREEKPLALMFPSLAAVEAECGVSALEARLLESGESPIVLLRRRKGGESGIRRQEPGVRAQFTEQSAAPAETFDFKSQIAHSVAPANPYLGAMLPYTPLHHLLMAELEAPIVATSGNLSDEPICTDEHEALERLGSLAELFLVHNRPIVRQVDDSVARVLMGRELVLRRARGYAPLPVHLKRPVPSLLAVGAQLKNAVAMSVGADVWVSQHIGDLETVQAFAAFRRVIASLQGLYAVSPTAVVCDAHPDYRSTQFAHEFARRGTEAASMADEAAAAGVNGRAALPVIPVQHHYAHVRACMAENQLDPPVLGICWDGTGYGLDGTIWGGEFLSVTGESFQRLAAFRPFRLPGGEKAIQEPRRVALGLLYEIFGRAVFTMRELAPVRAFSAVELGVLGTMLQQQINAPLTTSAGRLFDVVAALTGLRQEMRYEGQAAMELEFATDGIETEAAYPLRIVEKRREDEDEAQSADAAGKMPALPEVAGKMPTLLEVAGRMPALPEVAGRMPALLIMVDWEPMIWSILEDVRCRVSPGLVAARFHNTLVEAIVAVARLVGQERVALTGGCFQNCYLTERAVERLAREGFRPYWHQRIPPNDGGIALGQVLAAAGSAGR